MEYILKFINILKRMFDWVLTNSGDIKNIVDVFAIIIGGVFAIKGFNYIKSLREKKASATFGFWTRLSVKLVMLKNRILEDNGIINNLYSVKVRDTWPSRGAPSHDESIKEFLKIASETLDLIKSEPEQLPAYKGWTEDYLKLIQFLDDIFHYDISNPNNYFKFNTVPTSIERRTKYCEEICDTIDRIINGIKKTQETAELKLYE